MQSRSDDPSGSAQAEACEAYLGALLYGRTFNLVLTADPGDFSGTPEAHHIISNMRRRRLKPRSETVCGGLYFGSLMGQAVLVGTTGIGPTAAGLCTLELLSACGPLVNELVYFGTSGWSPQLGGVLNPPDCSHANADGQITRMGDICVSPVSVNWVCKKSTWSLQAQDFPNQCARPAELAGPNATYLYGECQFYKDNLEANLRLAQELRGAAAAAEQLGLMPTRADVVQSQEERYWGLMAKGTGVAYPPLERGQLPAVHGYDTCAEVDSQLFFTGAPWEVKGRDYAAATIGAATGTDVGAHEVIAVSAMEGVGVAEAVQKYNGLDSTSRPITYSNVRTASNVIHHPLTQTSNGVWDVYQEVPEDYVNGYAYAIATGSAAILSMYQQRCLADLRAEAQALGRAGGAGFVAAAPAGGRGDVPRICQFSIDYP